MNSLSDYALPDEIFVDANEGGVKGVTSNFVLNEVTYVILIGKGSEILGTQSLMSIKSQLRRDYALSARCYQSCKLFLDYINILKAKGLRVIDVSQDMVTASLDIGSGFGLLPTDSLHAATCRAHNIKHIATNDADFERVDDLQVWKPRATAVESTL